MIAIKNWNKEIQQAKEEIIINKEFAWQQEWKNQWFKNNKECKSYSDVPNPPKAPKEIAEVKSWFIGQWQTGFVVCDLEELMKMPKKQRDKILKLGDIQS